jgi:hypothetical protein
MPRYLTLPALAAILFAVPALAQNATAQMTGLVVDENGKPLAGAHVLYTRQVRQVQGADGKWRDAPGETPFSSQAAADATGKYQLPQLPPGDYNLCMYATGYLTTCEWARWQHATVAASQALSQGTVQLTKAVTVTIRVNDPLHLLGSANQISAPLAAGVREQSGRFHPARETATDTTGHTLQVSVPYATALTLWLHSWRFLLTDSIGAPVNHLGAQFPFQVAANGTAPSYTFNITGEAPK